MASGSNYTTLTSTAGNKARLEISWNEDETNTSTNKSKISATGRIKMTSGSFASDYVPYLKVYWHNSDNNTDTLLGQDQVSSLGSSWYSVSGTQWFEHKSDGTSKGYGWAEWTGSSFAYTPQAGSVATSNTDLTTIPRASEPSTQNGYIGDTITIYTNRRSQSFTHTLTYTFGSLSGTIGTNIGDSTPFTIPTSFYAQMPNEAEKTCTITCTTYNGSTQIGTAKTTTFKVMCDETECKPTFDFNVVLTDGTATTSLTGSSNILIANYSEAEIQWTATPKHSATINRVYLANFDNSYTTSPITIYFSDNSSYFLNGFNLTCVDSREFATSLSKTYTIKQWFRPSLTLTTTRTSPTASEVKASFTGQFFNDSFGAVNNTLALRWKYKLSSSSTWTTGGTLVSGTDYTINNNTFYSGTSSSATEIVLSSSLFDYDKTYDIAFETEDQIATTTYISSVPKGKPVYWWDENGLYWGSDDSKFITENEIKKHLITATISTDKTLTSGDVPLTLVNEITIGNKLSISNGGIVIGSGVNHILISMKVQYADMVSSTNSRYAKIKKSGTEVIASRTASPNNTNGLSVVITPTLLAVSENDVITASVQGVANDVIRSGATWTNVTIEVID